jgi:hypothetical protein
MTHTPTPWSIKRLGKQMYIESKNGRNESGGFVCDMQRGEAMQEDYPYIEADAELIVRAVNSYEELRKLLEGALTCAPELMNMPMGEKILKTLNRLNESDRKAVRK